MAVRMQHPSWGERTVKDEQVEGYARVGWALVAEVVPPIVEGSRADVLAAVGDDPEKARQALAAEQSRSHPRSTLVTALAPIADTTTTSEV